VSRRAPRARHLWSILVVLAVLAGLASVDPVAAATPAPSDGAAPVGAGLEQKAAEGDVRVIAVTDAPGEQVVDDVLASVPEGTVSDVSAGPAPQVVATVDAEGLEALSQAPGVTRVVEDKVNRMAADTWPTTTGVSAAKTAGWDGTGRTVAVLDAGVQSNHPFLAGKVLAEGCFSTTTTDIQSLCDNGVAQQIGTGAAAPCTGISGCDHGTHVAGLAVGGPVVSPAGLTGAAQGASLVAAKVFSKGTSSAVCDSAPPCLLAFDSDIIAAMSWITSQRQGNVPGFTTLDAVNLSLGGGLYSSACDAENPSFTSEVTALRDLGVLTVVATGNSGSRSGIASPACISSVVSVGASTGAGAIASFSNLSSFTTVVAPGVSMTSSIPGSAYQAMSGTSMATPVISGAIAALRERTPSATPTQLVTALRSSGDPIVANVSVGGVPTPTTFIEVQLDSALAWLAGNTTAPSAPSAPVAVGGDRQASVSWSAPASNGGATITGYTVTASPGGQTCTTGPTAASCVVTGVTNGVSTTFSVVASNAIGPGPASAPSNAVVPKMSLSSPLGSLDLVSAGVGSVSVSGWALDPDTAAPIQVHVYVDGTGTALTADGSRPDVGAAFGYGSAHGFSAQLGAAGGPHTVCAYAINVGAGGNVLIGCRSVTVPSGSPFGSIDVMAAGVGSVTVAGWAIDPDTAAPIQVHVYVDGVGYALDANGSRADVGAAFGYGPNHGYGTTVAAGGGAHLVCAYAINVGAGGNVLLGCRVVNVPTGPPFGSLDQATRNADGTVSVAGWAIDPDTTAPIEVHVYVGSSAYPITGFPLVAGQSRPDVAAVLPPYGPNHGYSFVVPPTPPGLLLCAFAINAGPGQNTTLGCVIVP
jgi:subtilisin family serine protease